MKLTFKIKAKRLNWIHSPKKKKKKRLNWIITYKNKMVMPRSGIAGVIPCGQPLDANMLLKYLFKSNLSLMY